MSVSAISCADEDYSDLKMEEDPSAVASLAKKIQLLWGAISDFAIVNVSKVVHIVRSAIGAVVRDAFFFPLKCGYLVNKPSIREQLQIEESYSRDFWDPTKSLDPLFKDQALIREKFVTPEDRVFPIQLKSGEMVEITCRIIQTKEGVGSTYNFVQVPGIHTTISNNIGGIYPYLSAFLNAEREKRPLSPARFIVISENNLNFKPATVDEAGFVLLETLKALKAEFGEIDQLVAHSLGNIFFANALKQVEDPKVLPKHICLDRGPISVWEASKKYFWGLGPLMYFMVKLGGWASNTEQDVIQFCQKWKERPTLLIAGVKQDHHFSDSANLCLGEKINKVPGIEFLVFNPPNQLVSNRGQHNLRSDFLNPRYLIKKSDFMKSNENLAEAIIRHSLPANEEETQQQTA